jgi:serine/threonine-protein kinase CTR1
MLKSLRHPRVVLFMGACLNPGNLAIVTEYLPRNSLYQVTSRSSLTAARIARVMM